MTDKQASDVEETPITMGYTLKNKMDSMFLASPGLPGYFQTNFDYQLVRAIAAQTYGGAEVGECLMTAKRIQDGDIESFTQAWTDIATRMQSLAETSLKGGHTVSAREAFLRATTEPPSSSSFIPIHDSLNCGARVARASSRRRLFLSIPAKRPKFPMKGSGCPATF